MHHIIATTAMLTAIALSRMVITEILVAVTSSNGHVIEQTVKMVGQYIVEVYYRVINVKFTYMGVKWCV